MTNAEIRRAKMEWEELRGRIRKQVRYGAPAADR